MTTTFQETAHGDGVSLAPANVALASAPADGEEVIWLCHTGDQTTITPPTGFTQIGSDYNPAIDNHRFAAYRLTAGASEPTVYTGTLSGDDNWVVDVLVFSSTAALTAGLTVLGARTSATHDDIVLDAIAGRVIANNSLSVGWGGHDWRKNSGTEAFTQADNSHIAFGIDNASQTAGGAYRIYTNDGETFSGSLTIQTADGSTERNYNVAGIHFTLVEPSSGTPIGPIARNHLNSLMNG